MVEWEVGDEAILDNVVPGKIDGFYEEQGEGTRVVFRPHWHWRLGIWGRLDREGDPEPDAHGLKHVFLSLIIVHPSNLSRP